MARVALALVAVVLGFWWLQWQPQVTELHRQQARLAQAQAELEHVQAAGQHYRTDVQKLHALEGELRRDKAWSGPPETSADQLTPHFGQELEALNASVGAISPGGTPASPAPGLPSTVPRQELNVTLQGSHADLLAVLRGLDGRTFPRLVKLHHLTLSSTQATLDLEVIGRF